MTAQTSNITLTGGAYQQIVDVNESFLLTVTEGQITFRYDATQPPIDAEGHPLLNDHAWGHYKSTQKVWARGNALLVITKELIA